MNRQKLEPLPPELLERARSARRILVLTGAGMSAESGVPTFRDESAGLWSRYSPEAMATEEGWRADPELVWAWYLWRIGIVNSTSPNAGHEALARWAGLIGEGLPLQRMDIVTQNIDDLHERAGSVVLAHLHGSRVSVVEQTGIVAELLAGKGQLTFRSLVAGCDRLTTVVRFLAVLELFRAGRVSFEQAGPLTELSIRWSGGEATGIVVDEYETEEEM